MANPTIIVSSTAGSASDTACSGAGPGDGVTSGSILTGTAGATNATGQTVTLDGSPSLTNVAVDGSHVLLLIDATTGNRNFTAITGKDNTAKTVTVSPALAANLTGKSWAIGGPRATLFSAQSLKLFTNNALAGDALGGWTIQMQSAHVESSTGQALKVAGSQALGPVILEGKAGAATRPVLTNTANSAGINLQGASVIARGFNVRNTNATKTASYGLELSGADMQMYDIKCAEATNHPWKGFWINSSSSNTVIESCEVSSCVLEGIAVNAGYCDIHNNKIYNNAGAGIAITGSGFAVDINSNTIFGNTLDGINLGHTGTNNGMLGISNNTIHNNKNGLNFTGNITTNITAFRGTVVQNNNITGSNGSGSDGYGINYSSGAITTLALQSLNFRCRNNNFGSGGTANATGTVTAGVTLDASNITVDPGYANSSTGDFTPGTTVVNLGWPLDTVGLVSAGNRSYSDIGLQKQFVTGGGGGGVISGFGTAAFTGDSRG